MIRKQSTGGTERSCPVDGCGNEDLESVADDDSDFDYFCHWCGNLFTKTEDGLDVQ